MLKVSKRIQEIISYISPETEEVWDLCCDHGIIGFAALKKSEEIKSLTFVDVVPKIIDRLKNNILVSDIPTGIHIQFLTKNATEIKINSIKKVTLIIAGIGGILSVDIIEEILKNHPSLEFDIILSAHDNMPRVRSFLSKSELFLADEKLILDNKKYYEILKLSRSGEEKVSLFGKQMWNTPQQYHLDYLSKEISFLKNKLSFVENHELKLRLQQLETVSDQLTKSLTL